MLLGSSLGALFEENLGQRGSRRYFYRALCADWRRTREEGRRMRVKEDPLRAHLHCEGPLKVRTNEEEGGRTCNDGGGLVYHTG